MKIWHGFGSEHSANLVMIGRFKTAKDAKEALALIEKITAQVKKDQENKVEVDTITGRYGRAMLDLLANENFVTVGASELEQFAYEVNVSLDGTELTLTTEEYDVSAFFKLLIHHGARLDVYSAHDYPGTDVGSGG